MFFFMKIYFVVLLFVSAFMFGCTSSSADASYAEVETTVNSIRSASFEITGSNYGGYSGYNERGVYLAGNEITETHYELEEGSNVVVEACEDGNFKYYDPREEFYSFEENSSKCVNPLGQRFLAPIRELLRNGRIAGMSYELIEGVNNIKFDFESNSYGAGDQTFISLWVNADTRLPIRMQVWHKNDCAKISEINERRGFTLDCKTYVTFNELIFNDTSVSRVNSTFSLVYPAARTRVELGLSEMNVCKEISAYGTPLPISELPAGFPEEIGNLSFVPSTISIPSSSCEAKVSALNQLTSQDQSFSMNYPYEFGLSGNYRAINVVYSLSEGELSDLYGRSGNEFVSLNKVIITSTSNPLGVESIRYDRDRERNSVETADNYTYRNEIEYAGALIFTPSSEDAKLVKIYLITDDRAYLVEMGSIYGVDLNPNYTKTIELAKNLVDQLSA